MIRHLPESFRNKDRFLYSPANDCLTVDIPVPGSVTRVQTPDSSRDPSISQEQQDPIGYERIPRARSGEIHQLVGGPARTRGGHLRDERYQTAPSSKDHSVVYYMAQCLHYGLDFNMLNARESAKATLRNAIAESDVHKLRVPKRLRRLEMSLRKRYKSSTLPITAPASSSKEASTTSGTQAKKNSIMVVVPSIKSLHESVIRSDESSSRRSSTSGNSRSDFSSTDDSQSESDDDFSLDDVDANMHKMETRNERQLIEKGTGGKTNQGAEGEREGETIEETGGEREAETEEETEEEIEEEIEEKTEEETKEKIEDEFEEDIEAETDGKLEEETEEEIKKEIKEEIKEETDGDIERELREDNMGKSKQMVRQTSASSEGDGEGSEYEASETSTELSGEEQGQAAETAYSNDSETTPSAESFQLASQLYGQMVELDDDESAVESADESEADYSDRNMRRTNREVEADDALTQQKIYEEGSLVEESTESSSEESASIASYDVSPRSSRTPTVTKRTYTPLEYSDSAQSTPSSSRETSPDVLSTPTLMLSSAKRKALPLRGESRKRPKAYH